MNWYPEPSPWTPEPYPPTTADYPATDARSSVWRDQWSGNPETDKAWRPTLTEGASR